MRVMVREPRRRPYTHGARTPIWRHATYTYVPEAWGLYRSRARRLREILVALPELTQAQVAERIGMTTERERPMGTNHVSTIVREDAYISQTLAERLAVVLNDLLREQAERLTAQGVSLRPVEWRELVHLTDRSNMQEQPDLSNVEGYGGYGTPLQGISQSVAQRAQTRSPDDSVRESAG